MINNQIIQLKKGIFQEEIGVKQNHRINLFQNLLHKVSMVGLDKMFEQYELAKNERAIECTGKFSRMFGLPCEHFIRRCLDTNSAIEITDIHPQWILQLDYEPLINLDEPRCRALL